MAELFLRAASAVITPRFPGPLAGYAARQGGSTGTHDELEANLVVLSQGDVATAWLALDAVAVTTELSRALAEIVRAEMEMPHLVIQVCASHSHSGPIGWTGSFFPGHVGDIDVRLRDDLMASVRDLAREANRTHATPVTAEWSSSVLAGVAANRVVADRGTESSLGVLALRARQDRSLLAIVFDFANHPTVLDPSNRQWSGDWPAAARCVIAAGYTAARRFGQDSAGAPVLLFLQGAAGDLSTRFVRKGSGFAEASRIGAIVGCRVLQLLEEGGERLSGELEIGQSELVLSTRSFPEMADSAEALDRARKLARGAAGDPYRAAIAVARAQGAEVQHSLAMARLEPSVAIPLTVVSIGDLNWAHAPLELFSSLAAELAARTAPARTRFVGYCNGYAGYLPDAEAYELESYEALTSLFEPTSAAPFLDALVELIPAPSHPKEQIS